MGFQLAGDVNVRVMNAPDAYTVAGADQLDRLTRDTQADGHLRATGPELEKSGKLRVDQQIIFVAAVIANLLAQQATAYSDRYSFGVSSHVPWMSLLRRSATGMVQASLSTGSPCQLLPAGKKNGPCGPFFT
jgi:hypothetical protein